MGNSAGGAGAFDIGEEVAGIEPGCVLHAGKEKGTEGRVSVFKYEGNKGDATLMRLKTLRHPFVLRFKESLQVQEKLYIVTEEVLPLRDEVIRRQMTVYDLLWGMNCILEALKFLHDDCGLAHQSITSTSIMVTRDGAWKIGGLNSCTTITESTRDRLTRGDLDNLGAMLENQMSTLSQDLLSSGNEYSSNLHKNLQRIIKRLRDGASASRSSPQPPASKFLSTKFFHSNEFLASIRKLHEIDSLLDMKERMETFMELGKSKLLLQWPVKFRHYLVLPSIISTVSHLLGKSSSSTSGVPRSSSSGSMNQPPTSGSGNSAMDIRGVLLPLMFQILPTPNEVDESLRNSICNCFVLLFPLGDRGIRSLLLSKIDLCLSYVPQEIINSKVFDNLTTGFSDNQPAMREFTLKSMAYVAPHLNERNLSEKLMKQICRLQASDPEPSIRTNSTVLIGRLAASMSEKARMKILPSSLLKAFRDPFPFARLAGVRALSSFLNNDYIDIVTLATRILPHVLPLCVDPSPEVREYALKCLTDVRASLMSYDQRLRVEKEKEESKVKETIAPESSTREKSNGWMSWSLSSSSKTKPNGEITPLVKASTSSKPKDLVNAPKKESVDSTVLIETDEEGSGENGWNMEDALEDFDIDSPVKSNLVEADGWDEEFDDDQMESPISNDFYRLSKVEQQVSHSHIVADSFAVKSSAVNSSGLVNESTSGRTNTSSKYDSDPFASFLQSNQTQPLSSNGIKSQSSSVAGTATNRFDNPTFPQTSGIKKNDQSLDDMIMAQFGDAAFQNQNGTRPTGRANAPRLKAKKISATKLNSDDMNWDDF